MLYWTGMSESRVHSPKANTEKEKLAAQSTHSTIQYPVNAVIFLKEFIEAAHIKIHFMVSSTGLTS